MHFLAIYTLASILSTALITKFWFFQNFLLNIFPFSSPILACRSMQLNELLKFFILWQAILDFGSPIFSFLNKNCLFKFDNTILSLSVIVTLNFLFLFDETPIELNIFKYSQPKAPAPIIKIFEFSILF